MTLGGIKPGDIVRCDVRGVTFHALVQRGPIDGRLAVAPIERNATRREVTARQVIGHWRRAAGGRS